MKAAITAVLLVASLFISAPLCAQQTPAGTDDMTAAREGNLTAQLRLADNYLAQDNITQAKYWFRKAAEQNNPRAQNELGKLILRADQSPEMLAEARVWFEKAAMMQYAPAQNNLANVWLHMADMNNKDSEEIKQARYWFEKAAAQGVAVAQYQLGMMYLHAWGVQQDPVRARAWFSKAAEQNQPDALYQMGVMYYGGRGCEGDNCRIALDYYNRAAALDHGPAQFYLAMMYLQGHGVTQDYDKGVSLMKAACDNDEPEACPWAKNLTEEADKFRAIFAAGK